MLYAFNRLYNSDIKSISAMSSLYQETKKEISKAISESHKTRTVSDETRRKLSESNMGKNKGKTRSAETIEKIRQAAFRKRPHSVETKNENFHGSKSVVCR